VTKALIQGDEIPGAELSREMASQANDEALVRSAERSVGEARLSLARSMGILMTTEAEAPVAVDPLPDGADRAAIDALAPAPLIKMALENRRDRIAAEKLRESGGVLLRAAETGLRPRLDAHGKISAGTVAETSLAQSAGGWSGPSFSVGLALEMPIGNNEAKGRLLQTQADLAERSITAADLDRNIRANVVQGVATLRASSDQLARMKEAVGLYGKTIDSEMERFRAGQSSLLDSIVTQDLQTNALFTFTIVRQQYAELLARLRYETGTLVIREGDRNVVRPGDLLKPPSAGK
jgi:outer membrane protein TolC